MLTLLLLLLASASGFIIINSYGSETFPSWPEKIAAGIALGIAGTSALGAILNIFLPTDTANIIAWIISLIVAGYSLLKIKNHQEIKEIFSKFDWTLVLVLSLLLSGLIYSQLLPNQNGLLIPNRGSNDTVFHLAQIEYMSNQVNWKFTSPYFAGEFINYPFLSEFFSSQLIRLDGGLTAAYHWPDIFLCVSLIIWLALLPKLFSNKFFGSLFFSLGVLFAGGLSYLSSQYFLAIPSSIQFPLQPISYQGLVLSFLLFQKSFLLGAPLAMAGLYAILKYLAKTTKNNLTWSLVFFGLLPFSHTHSFVAVSVGLAGILAGLAATNPEQARKFFKFIILFIVITLPQVLLIILMPKFSLGDVPVFRLGWMSNPIEAGGIKLESPEGGHFLPWFLLQLWNFGLLLLWPILGWLGWKQKKQNTIPWLLFCGGSLIWLTANLIQFQAWDYDNNKLFVYALVFFLLAAISYISTLPEKMVKKSIWIFASVVILSLPMSGFRIYQTLKYGLSEQTIIFTNNETAVGNWLKTNTAPSSILLTGLNLDPKDPTYLAGILSGRANSSAFGLWLYTHDTDFQPRLNSIKNFLNDPSNKTELKKIPADYFVLGPETLQLFPGLDTKLEQASFKQVYNNSQFKIYNLNN